MSLDSCVLSKSSGPGRESETLHFAEKRKKIFENVKTTLGGLHWETLALGKDHIPGEKFGFSPWNSLEK